MITGTHGYVATSLKKYIDNQVRNTHDNQLPESLQTDLISLRSDNLEQIDLTAYDAILHAAALVHKKETELGWEAYYKVNTELTEKLAQKALTAGVPHFIFMSSMSVYGINSGMISPDTEPHPSTFYGRSKLEAEKKLMEIYTQNDSGINHHSPADARPVPFLSIIRPPMIYGPDCPGNFSRLCRLAGCTPVFPKLHNQRSMIYIENLCEFIFRLLLQPANGIFCPQNAEYICTSDMVQQIAVAKNKKMRLIPHFEKMLKILSHRISAIDKITGNLTYTQNTETCPPPAEKKRSANTEIPAPEQKEAPNTISLPVIINDPHIYQVCDFKESIRRSV